MRSFEKLVSEQRAFFSLGLSANLNFRKEQLKHLKKTIKENETLICNALKDDLGKPFFESYLSEIGSVYREIDFTLKSLKNWAKKKKVPTPILYAFSKSSIDMVPKGVVFIIGSWNYPFQLIFMPLIGAIAAGNTIIVKPSELAHKSSQVINEILKKSFDYRYISCVEGDAEVVEKIIASKVDYVFFTGSADTGKHIASLCAKKLIPFTLEVGGKNPCLVDVKIDLEITAKRIVWGKFFNAGQTCIAPDYILVDSRIKNSLIDMLGNTIKKFYGEHIFSNTDYPRIVNRTHFDRLTHLLNDSKGTVVIGGERNRDKLFFSPTIVVDPNENSALMNEEIFGPILPIVEYKHIEDAIEFIKRRPIKSLALYIFSLNRSFIQQVSKKIDFGGCTINDTLLHFSNSHLPFGAYGGFGSYHGYYSFLTFSNYKPVLYHSFIFDSKIRYAPYGKKLELAKKLMK